MKKSKETTSFNKHLDKKYGVKGTETRIQFEEKAEAFTIGVIIKEARMKAHLTQEELAEKADTKKTYISRIERDGSDIRISTLKRIVEKGLGGILNIDVSMPKGKKIKTV
jgi:ribosome-binding protein aMBF1 (putative translation factor)